MVPPAGFSPEYIGGFVLLLVIAIGIGGVAWFKGRHDTYK